jgi:hypothetical protein
LYSILSNIKYNPVSSDFITSTRHREDTLKDIITYTKYTKEKTIKLKEYLDSHQTPIKNTYPSYDKDFDITLTNVDMFCVPFHTDKLTHQEQEFLKISIPSIINGTLLDDKACCTKFTNIVDLYTIKNQLVPFASMSDIANLNDMNSVFYSKMSGWTYAENAKDDDIIEE